MANNAPSTQFNQFPTSSATTAVDTAAERVGTISGETTLATNNGTSDTDLNSWDFGTVDISATAGQSAVKHLVWSVTDNKGNTAADNFRLWMDGTTQNGFVNSSVMKISRLAAPAGGTTGNLDSAYTANAITTSYTFNTIASTSGSPTLIDVCDDTTSIDISNLGTTDDALMLAAYMQVELDEQTGTYDGLNTAGYELQVSLKFDFS